MDAVFVRLSDRQATSIGAWLLLTTLGDNFMTGGRHSSC